MSYNEFDAPEGEYEDEELEDATDLEEKLDVLLEREKVNVNN